MGKANRQGRGQGQGDGHSQGKSHGQSHGKGKGHSYSHGNRDRVAGVAQKSAASSARSKRRPGGRAGPQAHGGFDWSAILGRERGVYLAAFLALALFSSLALAMSAQDAARHRSFYEEYSYANELFEDDYYFEAAEIYARLAAIYPDSHIIEMKQAICALSFEDFESTLAHAARAVELNPLLLLDESTREILAICYEQLGDNGTADMLRAYGKEGVSS